MDALQFPPLTLAVGKAGLAAGTTTTLTIGTTTVYSINGKAYSKSSVSNTATPTTDATTGAAFVGVPANYGCAYVIGVDSSGAVKVSQGPLQALDASGNFVNAPQFPLVPDTVCPLGYLITKCGSTASTWTFGSSNLAGPPTGVTFAFQDCLTLPGRPQVS